MRILCLGDLHAPYEHKKAVEWAVGLAKELQPSHIVQVGDAYDMFAYSRYPKVLKMLPEEELSSARASMESIWKRFQVAAPKAKCFQLTGNHDERPIKKIVTLAPELTQFVDKGLRDLLTFRNVKTVYDPKEELILHGIVFQHGYRSRLGDHCNYNQRSTVVGHSHTGGVVFRRNFKGVFFELNAGLLGDFEQPAFGYRSQRKMHTWTLGVGYVDSLGPRFIPYPDRSR